jgi:molecular chaperone DnaJ
MATPIPDLYALLGVAHDATDDEIRGAYRRLARELHPDVNGDPGAERRFKEVTAAYETLSDPGRRQQYDAFGQAGGLPDFFPFGDFGDLFEVFLGGAGARVGGRRRPSRRSRRQRGRDLLTVLDLSFEEALFGASRSVEIETLLQCSDCGGSGAEPGTSVTRCAQCGGTGQVQEMGRSIFGTVVTMHPCGQCEATGEVAASPCRECRGAGRIAGHRTIPVDVPGGVDDGMQLRVPDAGEDGRAGGPAGDLSITMRVSPHPVFERRGQDLSCVLAIPMTTAALGGRVDIEILDGHETIKLDPGTPSGAVVRVKGKGVPNLGRRGRGDLLVTVMVETPKPGSKDERRLLEQLADLRGEEQGGPGRLRRFFEP